MSTELSRFLLLVVLLVESTVQLVPGEEPEVVGCSAKIGEDG